MTPNRLGIKPGAPMAPTPCAVEANQAQSGCASRPSTKYFARPSVDRNAAMVCLSGSTPLTETPVRRPMPPLPDGAQHTRTELSRIALGTDCGSSRRDWSSISLIMLCLLESPINSLAPISSS